MLANILTELLCSLSFEKQNITLIIFSSSSPIYPLSPAWGFNPKPAIFWSEIPKSTFKVSDNCIIYVNPNGQLSQL